MTFKFKIVNETRSSGNEGRMFDDEKSQSWAFVAEDPEEGIAVNGIQLTFGHKEGDKFSTDMTKEPSCVRVAKRPGIIKDDWVTIVEPGTIFSKKFTATETEWTEKKDK